MAFTAAALTPQRSATPSVAPRQAPARTPSAWTVEVVGPRELPAYRSAWEDLGRHALDPNCFYEPWMLLPAIEHFGQGTSLEFVLVYGPNHLGERQLCGLFPFERKTRLRGMPVRLLTLWKHLHCFLCTPLVHRDCGRGTLQTLLEWAGADRRGATLLEMPFVAGDGPFAQALVDAANDRACLTYHVETWNRALLRAGADGDAYIHAALAPRHRRELQRMRRRLGESGPLETRVLQPQDDPAPWIEHFLDLEASGWKGAEQTALGCSGRQREYFTRIVHEAHTRGQLMMLGLFLNDKPVALKCNFRAGHGAFAFKIAFDESYTKYSPGVQLELDTILAAHKHAGLAWIDSCADANHPMINRLWTERRTLQHLLLSTGGWRGNLLMGLLPLVRSLKRILRPAKPVASSNR